MFSLFHQSLQLLFPEQCLHCNAQQHTSLLLCPACLLELPQTLHTLPQSTPISAIWGLGPYEGPLGSLIRRCKYKPDPRILTALCMRIQHTDIPWSSYPVITHVPTTKKRLFHRGFDQARELALILAAQNKIPHRTLLKRLDPFSQGLRDRKERTQNLSHRFAICAPPPSKVLLIDDVRTTGSTLEACAMTLLNEGAQEVHAIVLGY